MTSAKPRGINPLATIKVKTGKAEGALATGSDNRVGQVSLFFKIPQMRYFLIKNYQHGGILQEEGGKYSGSLVEFRCF
jgi:hypothetical protein